MKLQIPMAKIACVTKALLAIEAKRKEAVEKARTIQFRPAAAIQLFMARRGLL